MNFAPARIHTAATAIGIVHVLQSFVHARKKIIEKLQHDVGASAIDKTLDPVKDLVNLAGPFPRAMIVDECARTRGVRQNRLESCKQRRVVGRSFNSAQLKLVEQRWITLTMSYDEPDEFIDILAAQVIANAPESAGSGFKRLGLKGVGRERGRHQMLAEPPVCIRRTRALPGDIFSMALKLRPVHFGPGNLRKDA